MGDIAMGGLFLGVVFMCVTLLALIAVFVGIWIGIIDFPMPIPGK
jgi:hypothetical protein